MNGNVSDQKGAFMSDEAQQPHQQPTNVRSNTKIEKIQRALPVLQLLGGVTTALFLAAVVVPSFVRSGTAADHDAAAGSLHALTIGGVTFWFTLQNLGSALLGGVFGLLVALTTEFPAVLFKTARKFVLFQQGHLSSQTPSLGNPRRARFLSLEAPGAMHDVHVAQTNHAALD